MLVTLRAMSIDGLQRCEYSEDKLFVVTPEA